MGEREGLDSLFAVRGKVRSGGAGGSVREPNDTPGSQLAGYTASLPPS